jgi:pimeloyl-ACP methyl ester carboxylesterase
VKLLLRHRFDNLENVRTGTCPVLILHGEKDLDVPLTHGQRLARALGSRAQFEVVPGLGHNDAPFKPGQPGWQTIHKFLRGL